MIKTLLIKILPFLVPIIFLIIWYNYQKMVKKTKPKFKQIPLKTMIFISITVFFIGIIYFRVISQIETKGKYVPPYLDNGEVIPGQFINE